MKMRDMTERQYKDALQRHGFSSEGFMGYYKLGTTGTHVSVLNAGPSRRSKLAYLLAEYEKAQQRVESAQLRAAPILTPTHSSTSISR